MDSEEKLLDSSDSVYMESGHFTMDNTADSYFEHTFQDSSLNSDPNFFDDDDDDNDDDDDDDDDDDISCYYNDDPASEEAIENMPKMKYEKRALEEEEEKEEEEECVICQEPLEQGEELLSMPCHHYFHNHCILSWLCTRRSCPICRYQMPPNPNPNSYNVYLAPSDPTLYPDIVSIAMDRMLMAMEELLQRVQLRFNYHTNFDLHVRHRLSTPREELLMPREELHRSVPRAQEAWMTSNNYTIEQIPLDDKWFESMVALELRERKMRKHLFSQVSFSWKRRKSALSNVNWSQNMIIRSNSIIKPYGIICS